MISILGVKICLVPRDIQMQPLSPSIQLKCANIDEILILPVSQGMTSRSLAILQLISSFATFFLFLLQTIASQWFFLQSEIFNSQNSQLLASQGLKASSQAFNQKLSGTLQQIGNVISQIHSKVWVVVWMQRFLLEQKESRQPAVILLMRIGMHYLSQVSLMVFRTSIVNLLQQQLQSIILIIILIMYRNLANTYLFARSRLRKGPQLAPFLKDLTRTIQIKQQLQQYRKKYQIPTQNDPLLSNLMESKEKPKLGQRFKVDKQKLNKKIKKEFNKEINLKGIQTNLGDQSELKYLENDKSFIYDQKLELDFQQKFSKELFKRKQTTRMIKNQEQNYQNYLPKNRNNQFNAYQSQKIKLKNSRIDDMMGYKRNNQELKLLIQSGFMDDPKQLKMVIQGLDDKSDGMSSKYDVRMLSNQQQVVVQRQVQKGEQSSLQQTHGSMQGESNQIELMVQTDHFPELRTKQKLDEFLEVYNKSNNQQRQKLKKDLDNLHQIRQYEQALFLSRYDSINFRYKGRVTYKFMKEPQLLSYIKHEPIPPLDLLQFYEQNTTSLSKQNQPIITPAVLSQIYTKTSTYVYPETEQNNKINMLYHPAFIKMEKTLFRELDKISDQKFCDVVWAYAQNHQDEKGVLKPEMSYKVQQVIFEEFMERVHGLVQQDLGLVLRAIMKTNILSDPLNQREWPYLVDILSQILPKQIQSYEYETTLKFLTLIPSPAETLPLILNNLSFLYKYPWQYIETLNTFKSVAGFILNNRHLIPKIEQNRYMIYVKQMLVRKEKEVLGLVGNLSINAVGGFVVVMNGLNQYEGPNLPPTIINKVKKHIIDSINTQKEMLNQKTIPNIILALSIYDYHNNLMKYSTIKDLQLPQPHKNPLQQISLKSILPGRVFTYNSKHYEIYHTLAKVLENQYESLTRKGAVDGLIGLGIVGYKNEGVVDGVAYRVLEDLEKSISRGEVVGLEVTKELVKLVGSYSPIKRSTYILDQILNLLTTKSKLHFQKLPQNLLTRFFSSYINLFAQPTKFFQSPRFDQLTVIDSWSRHKILVGLFIYCYKKVISGVLKKMGNEDVISLYQISVSFWNNLVAVLQGELPEEERTIFLDKEAKMKIIVKELNQITNDIVLNQKDLSIQYKFTISLCQQLNHKRNPQLIRTINFSQIEKTFYNKFISQIEQEQSHIGTALPYRQNYKQILQNIKQNSQNPDKVVEKLWRIQDHNKNKVYFLATYQHLMIKNTEQKSLMNLFGLWKFYPQLYDKSWEVQLICLMLEV